jgi:hypothetical protein
MMFDITFDYDMYLHIIHCGPTFLAANTCIYFSIVYTDTTVDLCIVNGLLLSAIIGMNRNAIMELPLYMLYLKLVETKDNTSYCSHLSARFIRLTN